MLLCLGCALQGPTENVFKQIPTMRTSFLLHTFPSAAVHCQEVVALSSDLNALKCFQVSTWCVSMAIVFLD